MGVISGGHPLGEREWNLRSVIAAVMLTASREMLPDCPVGEIGNRSVRGHG